jgi:hypothetical protein
MDVLLPEVVHLLADEDLAGGGCGGGFAACGGVGGVGGVGRHGDVDDVDDVDVCGKGCEMWLRCEVDEGCEESCGASEESLM